MSIKTDLEDASINIEIANSTNEDTIKRISAMGLEADRNKMLRLSKGPKPEHFSDKQWEEWKRVGLSLVGL